MSFVDQRGRVRPASVGAVVAIHAVIGYAVISGLAMRVVRYVDPIIVTRDYPADAPPPPPLQTLPPPTRTAAPTFAEPAPIAEMPLQTPQIQSMEISQIPEPTTRPLVPATIDTPPPARPRLARGAAIVGNRAAWVTSDDYPPSSLRAGAQGITAILATIGSDGRVSACRVTASSGDRALDEAACRTYSRRARFTPALGEGGEAIGSERADRIRWQMPAQ